MWSLTLCVFYSFTNSDSRLHCWVLFALFKGAVCNLVFVKGFWYPEHNSQSNYTFTFPVPEAPCWLAEIVCGPSHYVCFPFTEPGLCMDTWMWTRTARGPWGAIRWSSQEVYMIRITDCTFNAVKVYSSTLQGLCVCSPIIYWQNVSLLTVVFHHLTWKRPMLWFSSVLH